jgi:hypothetical protein
MHANEPLVLYELPIVGLNLVLLGNQIVDVTATLTSGRSNYGVFEWLVRQLTGFKQGKKHDAIDDQNRRYEIKAFTDPSVDANAGWFNTAPSCTWV